MNVGRSLAVLLLLAAPLAAQRPAALPRPLRDLDAYLTRALHDWDVPGLAIAVVKDDSVVMARGFGLRRLGDTARVTERTLFAIASCTKAFTAAALAMLVDSGKLAWDDPVSKHLLGFQLFDPYASRELTIRDLLTHRSGLARGDALWWATPYSRDEILRRVRFLQPSWSFRSRYGYQNIMFLAAGQIVPAVTGQSWDDFVRRRIFTPLAMTTSNTSVGQLPPGGDVATPHEHFQGKLRVIAWRNVDNIGPAGSINSNAVEMAQWVRLQLGGGVYRGRRLLSDSTIKEMRTPQTVIPIDSITERLRPSTHFLAYGLGWTLSDYRGRKLVSHSGALDGMRSIVMLVPEERLGIVALSNGGEAGRLLTAAATLRVVDSYIGTPVGDWAADFRQVYRNGLARDSVDRAKEDSAHVPGTKPSLDLARYAGTYRSEMYGDLTVTADSGRLVLAYGLFLLADLAHWHYDTFKVTWRDPEAGTDLITFALDSGAKVDHLTWPGQGDFARVASTPSRP
jgi:CubicO group peptidase (beta-lactamase class C family)